jgi:hypothetical protein
MITPEMKKAAALALQEIARKAGASQPLEAFYPEATAALEAAERAAWRPIEEVVEPLLLQIEHCLIGFRIGKQDITAAMNVLDALAITARMSMDRVKEGVS